MDEVSISANGIRLGQLLKLVGFADTGGTAKELLAMELVSVNGAPETRRGAQLSVGDVVRCGQTEVVLVAEG
ncbi:MAG: hypothetical protein JWM93_1424 [Frankiales bacterium]|nr:hypothetical protein [Frankiales bacterium]